MDDPNGSSKVSEWVDRIMEDTDAFFTPEPTQYHFTKAPDTIRATGEEGILSYTTGLITPHEENNTVVARYFPDYRALYDKRGWTMFNSIDRVYDASKARDRLGFTCRTGFAEILDSLR